MTEPLPDRMHLEASNRQYLVLGSVSALFVVLFSAMRFVQPEVTDEATVWLTVFFAIVTLIAASAALFRRSWLIIDADGFESSEFRTLGKLAWTDVSGFRVRSSRQRSMPSPHEVTFELTSPHQKVAGRLSGLMFNGSIRISERYPVKGRALAELLNGFRERALEQQGGQA